MEAAAFGGHEARTEQSLPVWDLNICILWRLAGLNTGAGSEVSFRPNGNGLPLIEKANTWEEKSFPWKDWFG